MNKFNKKISIFTPVLIVLLLNPISLEWQETNMAAYMLLHIPGLVLIGFLIGKALPSRLAARWNALLNPSGISGLLLAVFTIAYWILPRSVDAAINIQVVAVWKFVTLPLLAGIPLSWSWHKLGPLAKGLVWANLISMLFVMSWLYTNAPVRLCNNFLVQQQEFLGRAMFIIGLILAVYFALQAFVGKPVQQPDEQMYMEYETVRL